MKLRVAIAGAGMVSRHHLIAWSRAARAEVVAIQNRTLEKAQNRASEFGIRRVYSDLEEMLDREKPDALDVAVGVEAHGHCVRKAADRGVHVLCQKPMAPSLGEAEALVADIGDRVRFMIQENWRFRPQYRRIHAWIREGSVGNIGEFHLHARSSGMISPGPQIPPPALVRQPFLADLPRLVIFELLIHHLDVIRYLLGPMAVKACWTRRIRPRLSGEDFGMIFLVSQNGAGGTVSGNLSAPGFPPRPEDRLDNLETLRLVEAAYAMAQRLQESDKDPAEFGRRDDDPPDPSPVRNDPRGIQGGTGR